MAAEPVACATPAATAARGRLAALRPGDLPAPRHTALKVLEACASPGIDASRLAAIVGAEPALAAELLRIVNSAWYGFSREVGNVQHAITLLGQRALRNLVLCVSVRDALRADTLHGADLGPLRDAVLRRATAARLLAGHAGADPDECFTIGLLQDLGLLALFRAAPEHMGLWDWFVQADPSERYDREREVFGLTHDDVGRVLAESWRLPEALGAVLGDHHRFRREMARTEPGHERLCRIAWTADWLAAMFMPGDERRRVRDAREALATEWQLEGEDADAFIARVDEAAQAAAAALGLALDSSPGYERVLAEANAALAEENLGMQELNWRLERVLAERDAAAEALRREVEKAKVVQRSLLPTPRAECWAVDDFDCPFYGINAAARDLSGDFFDFFPLGDGLWYFNLADVSGKGMDAALMMVKTSSLFHCLGKSIQDPARLLGIINAELCENPVRGMFVTMVAGILDATDGRLRMVNAGHPPALVLRRDGGMDVLPARSPPLGVVPELEFETEDYALGQDSLYLFTDGLIEASNGSRDKLGYAGVVDLVRRHEPVAPEERLARILGEVSRSHGLARDDVTVLLIERLSSPEGPAAAQGIVDPRAL